MIPPIRFGYTMPNKPPIPNVNQYSNLIGGGGPLELREAPKIKPPHNFPWLFTHRPDAKGAVHVLTIVPNNPDTSAPDANEAQVVFELNERAPFGGRGGIKGHKIEARQVLECPAGLVGDVDKDEAVLEAAIKEVKQETGYGHDVETRHAELLADQWFATSPGITTEHKALAFVYSAMRQPGPTDRTPDEAAMIKGLVYVPLRVFLDDRAFHEWQANLAAENITLGMDIPAVRGEVNRDRLRALNLIG